MPQGRGQVQYARIGGTRDGRITAYQLDVVQDAGAYPLTGSVLHGMTMRMTCGVYDIDNVGFTGVSTVTNMPSITAYRGAGRPEAAVAIERMVDRFAAEIGIDPAEVRRRNMIPTFLEARTTGVGTPYDVGDYPRSLELALEAAGYDELRAEQARAPGIRRPGTARDRHRHLRRDHLRRRRLGVRRGRAAARRQPDRAHRHDPVRAGPRHDVGDDRRPTAPACRSSGSRCCTATPTRSAAAGSPSVRGRCSSAARRSRSRARS